MLQKLKHEEFLYISKSALVGALTCISIFALVIFASITIGFPLIPINVIPKNVTSFDEGCLITGGVGIILGLVLRRRFPVIQRGTVPIVITSFTTVFAFGYGAWSLNEIWLKTEQLPLSLKLADCTNGVANIHITIPTGHDHQLELETSGAQGLTGGTGKSIYEFSGHMHISINGALIADMPIGSDKAWWTGSRYVLTGVGMQNTNVPPLSKFIQSNKAYDFEIIFEPPPPPGSSIWLYCLESKRDVKGP